MYLYRHLFALAYLNSTVLVSQPFQLLLCDKICHILLLQLASVLLAITGIVLFAYEENFKSANIIGVVLSVGAAIGAASYKVRIYIYFIRVLK